MTKRCIECKKLNENPLLKYCREHYWLFQNNNKQQTRIKMVSDKNKNTPAKFTDEVKAEILARDKVCIISGDPIESYHHVYFGANSNRGPNRNNADQGVGLSNKIHHEIHHGTEGKGKLYRLKCIDYVLNLKYQNK